MRNDDHSMTQWKKFRKNHTSKRISKGNKCQTREVHSPNDMRNRWITVSSLKSHYQSTCHQLISNATNRRHSVAFWLRCVTPLRCSNIKVGIGPCSSKVSFALMIFVGRKEARIDEWTKMLYVSVTMTGQVYIDLIMRPLSEEVGWC